MLPQTDNRGTPPSCRTLSQSLHVIRRVSMGEDMVKIIFPLCGAAGNSGFGRCGECYLQHLPSIHHRLGDRDKTWEILGNIEEKGKDGLCG